MYEMVMIGLLTYLMWEERKGEEFLVTSRLLAWRQADVALTNQGSKYRMRHGCVGHLCEHLKSPWRASSGAVS
jgi:hypothetical protein